jgi:hypothetical protein
MEFSFRSRILLELLLACLAVLTIFLSYLAIVVAVIAILFIINEVSEHNSERDDFKEKIFQEVATIVDQIILGTAPSHILRPNWESKAEGFKRYLLGA